MLDFVLGLASTMVVSSSSVAGDDTVSGVSGRSPFCGFDSPCVDDSMSASCFSYCSYSTSLAICACHIRENISG